MKSADPSTAHDPLRRTCRWDIVGTTEPRVASRSIGCTRERIASARDRTPSTPQTMASMAFSICARFRPVVRSWRAVVGIVELVAKSSAYTQITQPLA